MSNHNHNHLFQYYHYAYCLQEKLTHIGLRVSTILIVSAKFGPKKSPTKIQLFIHNFPCQTVRTFPLYILFTYNPNYLLLEWSKFASLPTPNSFRFHLVYTTCIKLIQWSNLNYKKLLKCVNTINCFAWI